MLSLGYTWTKCGSGQQFRIPTRWGKSGRINLIGTYSLHGAEEVLEVWSDPQNADRGARHVAPVSP